MSVEENLSERKYWKIDKILNSNRKRIIIVHNIEEITKTIS